MNKWLIIYLYRSNNHAFQTIFWSSSSTQCKAFLHKMKNKENVILSSQSYQQRELNGDVLQSRTEYIHTILKAANVILEIVRNLFTRNYQLRWHILLSGEIRYAHCVVSAMSRC